jgi:transcriptional regulator GlxA family with amidase domain
MWADNIRTLTIEVKPTFWEAWYGQLLILLMTIAVVAIIFHTYLYIKKLKRQQRETLEAYLTLLNTQPQTAPAVPSAQAPATQLNTEDEAFMSRVMTFVEAHLGDADVNIGDMAEAAATSKSGLNRKMKSLTGLTPADFMREARIKRACQLLKSSETAVADIAYQCGFTDPKYFSKCFRNTLGCSPSEYRLR